MSKPHGIILLGANGSGKTTLGRELARVLDFAHFDVETYWFYESDIPFTAARPPEERNALLLTDMKECSSFVVSGDISGWGNEFTTMFDLAVFLTAPTDIRLKRIEDREYERWGDRVRPGGDMYGQQQKFREFAAARDIARLEEGASVFACPRLYIDGTADYRETAADIAKRFYVKPGEPTRVTTAPINSLAAYRFTVIFARLGKIEGGWLYARHRERDTWETAGGHIEPDETPLECAKRELYEETGAVKFYINPAFDYSVHRQAEFSYGQVFFADVEELGALPPEYEMAEVRAFETIPDKMTYPDILPVLFEELQHWLGLDKPSDEYWDVFDKDRSPTGRLHRRGDHLPDGDYHLVVRAWIVNNRGEFLITRRAFNKIGFPGMWETPSGSALAGEDSLTATLREAEEECGLALLPENAEMLLTYRGGKTFYDVRLFRQEFDLADVALQDGETIDAKTASVGEIAAMIERGEFLDRSVVREFEILERMSRL
jgi:8-oxo-dGTP pyrophosphatase MutT (NUDIX family)